MSTERKYVLSIAGFDPSGGAGVLADIKTFEANKVKGLAVISANTFQNDNEFKDVDWIPVEKIIEQIEILRKRFTFEYVKIGLIESLQILDKVVSHLTSHISNLKLIWDPILKASAGFEFHKQIDFSLLEGTLSKIYLITPNIPEVLLLGKSKSAEENAKYLSGFCHVFLKGGHNEKKTGYDTLFLKEGKSFSFRPKGKNMTEKHGSGCVLSSAITANLAKGEDLHRTCLKAKDYAEKYLGSNKTLLGYHKL
ncbi:MAG TPA: hydroxymethylpyrimidine/phosphomethylpyrimidine kinase [Bacteroidia bacterium]|nr:hydroxymethylpyrimidine/phosphomethylpyrimidine kinase [Bacteroidia bacterium]